MDPSYLGYLFEVKTPAQLERWIEGNITDLATARDALRYVVLAVRFSGGIGGSLLPRKSIGAATL